MLFQQWSKTDMIKVRFQTYLQLTLSAVFLKGSCIRHLNKSCEGVLV